MSKSTIKVPFSIANCLFTRGYILKWIDHDFFQRYSYSTWWWFLKCPYSIIFYLLQHDYSYTGVLPKKIPSSNSEGATSFYRRQKNLWSWHGFQWHNCVLILYLCNITWTCFSSAGLYNSTAGIQVGIWSSNSHQMWLENVPQLNSTIFP